MTAGSTDDGISGPDPETTARLLTQIRAGDVQARNRLVARYLPILQRWAHGRLPRSARDISETDDLVQVTLLRALDHLDGFEPRREGAFLAYLRRILMNQVLDEIRRSHRRPSKLPLDDRLSEHAPSPLEEAIGREEIMRYEAALKALPERQQEAVFLRLELGFTHEEVATAIGSPSANAARMMVARALLQLADEMGRQR